MANLKLNAVKFGIAGGIVTGICVLLITLFASYFPGCSNLILERSEEHTSELQSHSFISYAVFCLKKKTKTIRKKQKTQKL